MTMNLLSKSYIRWINARRKFRKSNIYIRQCILLDDFGVFSAHRVTYAKGLRKKKMDMTQN